MAIHGWDLCLTLPTVDFPGIFGLPGLGALFRAGLASSGQSGKPSYRTSGYEGVFTTP